jgi:hypothetical protein
MAVDLGTFQIHISVEGYVGIAAAISACPVYQENTYVQTDECIVNC